MRLVIGFALAVLLCGCGGGGKSSSPLDYLAGNVTGTWQNADKGMAGTLVGTYIVQYVKEPIIGPPPGGGVIGTETVRKSQFAADFKDESGAVLFKATASSSDRVNDNQAGISSGSLTADGVEIATGRGVQQKVDVQPPIYIFDAQGKAGTAYEATTFRSVLQKAP